jgi:hypothetical protein
MKKCRQVTLRFGVGWGHILDLHVHVNSSQILDKVDSVIWKIGIFCTGFGQGTH